jgi:hypothetical protein
VLGITSFDENEVGTSPDDEDEILGMRSWIAVIAGAVALVLAVAGIVALVIRHRRRKRPARA